MELNNDDYRFQGQHSGRFTPIDDAELTRAENIIFRDLIELTDVLKNNNIENYQTTNANLSNKWTNKHS